jgi:hypothetical protein
MARMELIARIIKYRGTIAIHASSSKTGLNDLFKRMDKKLAPDSLTTCGAIIV